MTRAKVGLATGPSLSSLCLYFSLFLPLYASAVLVPSPFSLSLSLSLVKHPKRVPLPASIARPLINEFKACVQGVRLHCFLCFPLTLLARSLSLSLIPISIASSFFFFLPLAKGERVSGSIVDLWPSCLFTNTQIHSVRKSEGEEKGSATFKT